MEKTINNLYCQFCGKICLSETLVDHYDKFTGEKLLLRRYFCPVLANESRTGILDDCKIIGHWIYLQKMY